ncbi:hypothetical protein HQ487_03455 [Candidatus Uhrbacteria bacterium]|nr:hypothetical protein [Candidatus Uhrbacteria bacterium]
MTPDAIQRMAFDKDFETVEFSAEHGPRKDGKIELMDAIQIPFKFIPADLGAKSIYVVRLQSTRGMDSLKATRLGKTIKAYMDSTGTKQFATAAIGIIDEGQQLYGRWNTLVLTEDMDGNWSFANLRFTSVQLSTDENYGILRDNHVAIVPANDLVDTLLDAKKLNEVITDGYELETVEIDKHSYLVRADTGLGHALSVVSDGQMTILDTDFQVVDGGTFQSEEVVIPGITATGNTNGHLVLVSGNDESWKVQAVPRNQATGNYAQAFAQAS